MTKSIRPFDDEAAEVPHRQLEYRRAVIRRLGMRVLRHEEELAPSGVMAWVPCVVGAARPHVRERGRQALRVESRSLCSSSNGSPRSVIEELASLPQEPQPLLIDPFGPRVHCTREVVLGGPEGPVAEGV